MRRCQHRPDRALRRGCPPTSAWGNASGCRSNSGVPRADRRRRPNRDRTGRLRDARGASGTGDRPWRCPLDGGRWSGRFRLPRIAGRFGACREQRIGRGCRLSRSFRRGRSRRGARHGRWACHRRWDRRRRDRRSLDRRRLLRRQQAKWVDVSIRVGGDPHAEMDMRLQRDCVAALADDTDLCSLGDGRAALDPRRTELEHRHGVAILGCDRDRAAASGHRADEGDGPGGRCDHNAAGRSSDVDAAVLASRVRVRTDGERPQHRPFGRPGPGERTRRRNQGRKDDGAHRRDEPPTSRL